MFTTNVEAIWPGLVRPGTAELPVITAVSNNREFVSRQPFADIGIVALLHQRPTLVEMVKGWLNLGALAKNILVVGKSVQIS